MYLLRGSKSPVPVYSIFNYWYSTSRELRRTLESEHRRKLVYLGRAKTTRSRLLALGAVRPAAGREWRRDCGTNPFWSISGSFSRTGHGSPRVGTVGCWRPGGVIQRSSCLPFSFIFLLRLCCCRQPPFPLLARVRGLHDGPTAGELWKRNYLAQCFAKTLCAEGLSPRDHSE